MTKFITVQLIKFTIRRLRFLTNFLKAFTPIKTLFKIISNNKFISIIIQTLALYQSFRASFRVFGYCKAGVLFNLFLVILFIDYKNIDLSIPLLS